METPNKVVMVSGGFDPVHVGHVEYIERAAKFGDVVVALNSDAWLLRKKGYVFMPWAERKKILLSNRNVKWVVPVDDEDGTVCKAIKDIAPDVFANGGDRTSENTPESKLCSKLGIKMVFGLGSKVQASSGLVTRAKVQKRKWGEYIVLYDVPGLKVKLLNLLPNSKTSKQKHGMRGEHWIFPDDTYRYVSPGEWHQLSNDSPTPMTVVEVQTGTCEEDDIER